MGKCEKRAFQNGGAVSKADQLIAEMNAKYGVSGNAPAPTPAVQQPAPQPQPVQQPAPQQRGIGGLLGIIGGRQQQIDKAAGYANGGIIRGPGTAKSDSIPARVNETGEEIRVGNGERIVSEEQGAFLEGVAKADGYKSLDAMLEAGTGKPVGPTIKAGKRAAAGGWGLDNETDEYAKAMNKVLPPVFNDAEKIGPSSSPSIAGQMFAPVTNLLADSAQAARGNKTYEQIRAERSAQPSGIAVSAQPTPTGNPLVSGIVDSSFATAKDRFPLDAKSEFITGKNGAMPDSSGGGFVDGKTAYTVNSTSQDGISRVTASGKNPLITNIKPEAAVAGLNNQTIGQPADKESQGISRIANANRIRGEMIANRDKDIPAGGYAPGIMADPADEANAKLDAMRRSSMVSNLSPSQQAEFNMNLARLAQQDRGQQLASDNARYAADTQASRAAAHDNVIMRGQDLNAQNELARLQGNPLDNESKRLSLSQAQQLSMLQGLVLNGKTPEEQATAAAKIRALSGKQDREDRAAKPMEIADPNDPMGQRKILVRPNDDGTYTPMQPRRSYAEFSQAYLAKRPGTSAEQIKADYEQLYGSR